ncbi:MAG TPA: copper chaperone PCu(A)C [Stellaceae bacterium]|nr:copper chaperone PCu(A)C [Stellaceae bacterium]
MRSLFIACLLSLVAAAGPAMAQTPTQPAIHVHAVWSRATPGGAKTAVVYMTLTAEGGADRLVGASTPVADKAQLHSESMSGGVMEMRPLASLEVKPGTTTALKPGGNHLMLIGLKHPLKAGDSFPLTLAFEKSGKQEVTVHVEKVGAMGTDMEGMKDMPGMQGGATTGH